MVSEKTYRLRIERLREHMEIEGIGVAVVLGKANIEYFVGSSAPSAIIVDRGANVVLLTPRLEYYRALDECKLGDIRSYGEGFEAVLESENFIEGNLYKSIRLVVNALSVEGKVGVTCNVLGLESYGKLREALGEFCDIGKIVSDMRMVKDDEEMSAIKEAIRISEKALRRALNCLERGVTEAEVAAEVVRTITECGAEPAFWPIVAFGEHTAHPHAKPGLRKLEVGDLVKIDVGARIDGYCADITRTFAYGKLSDRQRRLIEAVLKANMAAIESIRPGVSASSVDAAARKVLREYGLEKYFVHGTGHGVGIEVHEPPTIGPTGKHELVMGMVFTVEPGVYVKGLGGARIEDMVYVTSSGAEVITTLDRELWVV